MRPSTSLFEMLYGATNIPFCIVEKKKAVFQFPDMESTVYSPRFLEICLMDIEYQSDETAKPIMLFLQPGYYLGLYRLNRNALLIFGPSISYVQTRNDILPWLNGPLYKDNAQAMESLLLSLHPVSVTEYLNRFCLAIYLYNHELITPAEIYTEQDFPYKIPIKSTFALYVFKNRESSFLHTPQSLELSMMQAVETGNISKLSSLVHQPYHGGLGVLSFFEERQHRYMFVTAAAVIARAAMRGGVDYETACSMADSYCQRMDSLTKMSQIELLQHQMFFDFCQTVADLSQRNYSNQVKECCNYIHNHTHEKIVLRDLTQICQLSERRLSQKFQKETGINIVDYIHKAKTDEAIRLLNHSNFTISEISNYLGYNNQSYFTAVFKKYCGKTPNEYRAGK